MSNPLNSEPSQAVMDKDRLSALANTRLMDSVPEEAFDRAVRIATRLLGTPVGLLSLVDGERQFFKAQIGLPEPTASARQTPLTHSFCQHVVTADAPLIVQDARNNPLVRDNLAVPDLDVIAYLGVPVHSIDGHVLGSFCAIQSEPRDWTDQEREALEDIAAGIETEIALRQQAEQSLKMEAEAVAAEERFRLALHAGKIGTYDFDPKTQTTRWDSELYRIWGLSEDEPDIFTAIQETIHPTDIKIWETDVAASLLPSGSGRHDIKMRITRPDNGKMRWLHAIGQTTFEDGEAVRMVGTVSDITAEKDSEQREQLLKQELNHRVKNLFAIVSGMISMTARTSLTPTEMAERLRGRVEALASAHALIQPAIRGDDIQKTEVTLQTLVSSVIDPHMRSSDSVELAGPALPLNPDAASNLALVLHELATNAAKYGALSKSAGKLTVDWDIVNDPDQSGTRAVKFTWAETGGPQIVSTPETKGFGSTLINMTVSHQMRGGMQSDWRPEGVSHELILPLANFRV